MLDLSCDMTPSELFQAYYDCRRTKRNSPSALKFEDALERNLMHLYHELISGEYAPGQTTVFVVEYPKVREVWAASFRDRVVHHLIYNRISDRFHKRFIHDSYACIPDKGTHRAVARMEHFSRSVTNNHTTPGFVLKMDVASFFVSINRLVLDELMTPYIPEVWWLNLVRTVMHRNPVPDAIVVGAPEKMRKVPKHKSLFHAPPHTGITIGSLISQFEANIIMNVVDQYAKHTLKLGRYVRYVDDITVFGSDAAILASIPDKVDSLMRSKLYLGLHPNKTSINKVEHGFDALGYVIRPYCKYLRRSTIHNAFAKLDGMCRANVPVETIRDVANSYFGILGHSESWRERTRLANMLKGHGHIISLQADHMFSERIPI